MRRYNPCFFAARSHGDLALYFLLPSLEDLERECSGGFSIDSTKQTKSPSSLLRLFLPHREDGYSNLGWDNDYHGFKFIELVLALISLVKDGYSNLGWDNDYHGFKFIEAAYIALKWSKEERKPLSLDILSGLMKALLHFARASVKSLEENSTNDSRKQSQNSTFQEVEMM